MEKNFWIPKETKLLVTSRIHFELDAASEVWHALKASGVCENADVFLIKKGREWIRGLIAFVFDYDPLKALREIKKYFLKKPWIMEFTERIIPIEVVANDIETLSNSIGEIAKKRIGENESWKIVVEKHGTKYKKMKIIEKVAKRISWGKVDLNNPDWIVHIDAIKTTLAATIIKPDEIIRKKEIKNILRGKELQINKS